MSGAVTNGSNGNGHFTRWISQVSATVVAALLLWMFMTMIKNSSEIELLKSRVYGIEHRGVKSND